MEPAQDDAAGVVKEVSPHGIEARRWTVVFHREAENWFFDTIAMGHFKHVSAFAWLEDAGHWLIYDVGFRRTRLKMLGDNETAKKILTTIVSGNCTVTTDVCEDELPWLRLGMFCTTAVAHLVGVRCAALRPDALYRHLIAKGGTVLDYGAESRAKNCRRPQLRSGAGAGAENLAGWPADAGAG